MAWLKQSLLIWLLVLAVPAQGLAAVTMAFCGPTHSGLGPTTAMVQPAQPGLAQVQRQGQQATVGGAAGQEQRAAFAHCEEHSVGDASDLPPSDLAKTHSCSVCATCCSVGALPTLLLAVPVVAPAGTAFATLVATPDSVVVDGLERPPRTPPA